MCVAGTGRLVCNRSVRIDLDEDLVDRQRFSLALAGVLIAASMVLAAMASLTYGRPTHPRTDVQHQVAFADRASATPAGRIVNSIRAAADAGGADRLTALMVWVAVVAMYTRLCIRAFHREVSQRRPQGIARCRACAPSRAPPSSSVPPRSPARTIECKERIT